MMIGFNLVEVNPYFAECGHWLDWIAKYSERTNLTPGRTAKMGVALSKF